MDRAEPVPAKPGAAGKAVPPGVTADPVIGVVPGVDPGAGVPAPGRRLAARQWAVAWLLLALSLLCTLLAWNWSRGHVEHEIQESNEILLSAMQVRLQQSFFAYETLLKAAAAYARSVPEIEQAEWNSMVDSMALQKDFIGMEGLGFAVALPASAKQSHEQAQRKRLQGDYVIRPLGTRVSYAPLDYYLRTAQGPGPGAGFDMLAEPLRRAAMERARESGRTTLSDPVLLLANSNISDKAGFVMFVPVFRQQILLGWVCAPIRMDTLMAAIIKEPHLIDGVRITDPTKGKDRRVVYSDQEAQQLASSESASASAAWSREVSLNVGDRHWNLQLAFAPVGDMKGHAIPGLILGGGIVLSLLLFAAVTMFMKARRKLFAEATVVNGALQRDNERLQTSLLQQGQQLQSVLEASPHAVMMASHQKIRWVNPAAADMLGYTPAQLAGQELRLLFAGEAEQQACSQRIAAALEAEPLARLEQQLVARDGHKLDCAGVAIALERSKPQHGVITVFHDAGGQKQREQLLQEIQDFNIHLFDLAPAGLALAHMDGRVMAVNHAFAGLFGYTQAQAQALDFRTLAQFEHGEFDKMLMDLLATTEQATNVEKQIAFVDGRRIPVRLQLRVARRQGESLIWAAVQNQAIEKDMAQRLAASQVRLDALAQRVASLEDSRHALLSNVALALATPLNAIAGLSELLVDGIPQPLEPEQKKYAGQILDASRESLELIRELSTDT